MQPSYLCSGIYMYIYVYVYICAYIYMHIYVCIYMYIYICIYICTYIYIFIYICVCVCVCVLYAALISVRWYVQICMRIFYKQLCIFTKKCGVKIYVENFYVSAEIQNLMFSAAICTSMCMRTKNVGEQFSGEKYDKVVCSRLQQCVWMSVCMSTVLSRIQKLDVVVVSLQWYVYKKIVCKTSGKIYVAGVFLQ